jgi:uncharacterized protein (TIGR02145 family)
MAENLRARVYPNGDSIPYVASNGDWSALLPNNTDDACSYFKNDPNTRYGLLYTYAAAIADNWLRDNVDGQGACPDGWHLPEDDEWKILEGNVDTQYPVGNAEWDRTGFRGYDVGMHLKMCTGCLYGGNGDNTSHFSASPDGYRYPGTGAFCGGGQLTYWWSATEYTNSYAWTHYVSCSIHQGGRSHNQKNYGFSVRCIRND